MTQSQLIMGFKGGGGWTWAKAQALPDCAGHQLTWCNVSQMSLAGHGLTWYITWAWHRCLIIAWTRPGSLVLYDVINAACTPKGGLAKVGAFQPQVCHWALILHPAWMLDAQLKSRKIFGVWFYRLWYYCLIIMKMWKYSWQYESWIFMLH